MPKGTIRNPGSKKPMLSVKTWAGKQLPLRSKNELNARFKNLSRENFPTTSQYAEDRKAARVKKEVRAEPGTRVRKMKAPVGKGGR